MTGPTWQRWILFIALVTLGLMYVAAYVFFRVNSRDFAAALFNSRARDYAGAHPVDVPATLRFTSGSSDLALLGSGWYAPAPEGTWTGMDDVWLSLGLHRGHGAVGVSIETTAFLSRRHKRMKVGIDLDGRTVGQWQRHWSDPSRPFDFCIPPGNDERFPAMLHIHIEHSAVPFVLGQGQDTRLLGLLLHTMTLSDGCPSDASSTR